jgi:hypothetical protein
MHTAEEKGIRKSEKGKGKTTRKPRGRIILKLVFKTRFRIYELVYDRCQWKAGEHS